MDSASSSTALRIILGRDDAKGLKITCAYPTLVSGPDHWEASRLKVFRETRPGQKKKKWVLRDEATGFEVVSDGVFMIEINPRDVSKKE